MSNSSFNLPTGLKVGPVTIDADTGAITTSGNIVVSGGGQFVGTNAPGGAPSPAPAVTGNVALLLHFDGTNGATSTTDSSLNALSMSFKSGASISTTAPKFGSASLYLNGSGSALGDLTSSAFAVGTTTEFTFECWIKPAAGGIIFHLHNPTNGNGIHVQLESNGTITLYNPAVASSTNATLTFNQWQHFALVRSIGAEERIKIFVNGVKSADVAYNVNYQYGTPNTLMIGAFSYFGSTLANLQGYIDEVRFIVGQALYSNNFTSPVQAFTDPTPPSNVKLLLNMNGSNGSTTFTDGSGYANTVTANGGAQLSTSVKKYGTASAYFSGTSGINTSGAYLSLDPTDSDLKLGYGDFTIETWIYMTSIQSAADIAYWPILIRGGTFNTVVSTSVQAYELGYSPQDGNKLRFAHRPSSAGFNEGTDWFTKHSSAVNLNLNQWYHVAVTRNGSNLKIFLDGIDVSDNSTGNYDWSAFNLSIDVPRFDVGRIIGGDGSEVFWYANGYIDDLRIVKGQALYTSNFIPPTAELTTTVGTPILQPTYAITANTYAVNEGSTVQFTVTTTNVANSTVLYWTTSQVTGNITTADFSDSVTSGNVTITSNTATFTRTLAADLTTEGGESFAIQLRTDSISGNIRATSNTVVITDSSTASAPAAPTFVASTLPSLKSWSGIAYGDGKFVAVGGPNGLAVTANDGVSWSSAASPVVFDQFMGEYGQWQSVAYGNGKFVAVGGQDYTNKAAHSTDGSTWTEVTMPAAKDWSSVAFGGGTFVAASYGSPAYLAKSTDGINWTQIATFPALVNPAGVSAGYFLRVAYLNDRFYVFETSDTASQVTGNLVNNYAYSTNGGSTWTTGLFPIYKPSAMAYGNGTYVVLKGNSNSGSDQAAYSTNGTSWTAITLPSTKTWDSIAFTNGQFVAVGMSDGANEMDFPEATDKAIYSTDGINWTEIDMPSNKGWKAIAGGNNKFVVVATSMMGGSNSAART